MGMEVNYLFHQAGRILLSVCFLIVPAEMFAQSGWPSPTPPTPAPITNPDISTEAAGAPPSCEKVTDEIIYIPPVKIRDFIKELNRLGNCGYRLEKADKLPFSPELSFERFYVFAVVKRYAGDKYEYDWFEAIRPGETQTRINERAKKGFYFRKNFLFDTNTCVSAEDRVSSGSVVKPVDDVIQLITNGVGAVFIVERKNGSIKNNEYRVLDGVRGEDKKNIAEDQQKLDDYVAKGYRPVAINYGLSLRDFVVLVEKDPDIKPEGDYLLLRHIYGITKKFAKLSQEGCSPILVGWTFAVMHRTSHEPLNVSYFAADNFPAARKKLPAFPNAHFQVKGLYLQTCYTPESKLFFTLSQDSRQKYDYQFLEMKNYRLWKDESGRLRMSYLEPPSEEVLRKFRQFLKDGYVVREMLEANQIYIIFERSKP